MTMNKEDHRALWLRLYGNDEGFDAWLERLRASRQRVFEWASCCQCGAKTNYLDAVYLSNDEVFCAESCKIAYLDEMSELWLVGMTEEVF